MMSKELNIIRRVLIGNSFNKDGYEYRFLSIDSDEKGWSYDIVVDVTLPKKGQSYATPVFSGHIHDILSNIWKYIGTSFSYSEKILVDGEDSVKGGVYISPKKQKEVFFTMVREIDHVKIKTDLGNLSFDVSWKPMEKFYSLDDVYLDFNFNIQISKFILDGAYVKPNLKMADDVAGTILNVMYDTDYLRDEINNVIYDVMADEIDVTKVDDLYYQVLFYISKIDGFEVNGRYSNYYDLEPNMFN
jgi:hypothetical protein